MRFGSWEYVFGFSQTNRDNAGKVFFGQDPYSSLRPPRNLAFIIYETVFNNFIPVSKRNGLSKVQISPWFNYGYVHIHVARI